jgi:hypothetical protein
MSNIQTELVELLSQDPFKSLTENAMSWIKLFGVRSYLTPTTVAIPILPSVKRSSRILTLSRAIDVLVNLKKYKKVKQDILKQIVSTKDTDLLLSNLRNVKFLYGVTILSVTEGIEVTYNVLVTNKLNPFEQVIVKDEELCDQIEELRFCKMQRNVCYPKHDVFSVDFFYTLKSILIGKYEEVQNKESKNESDLRSKRRIRLSASNTDVR